MPENKNEGKPKRLRDSFQARNIALFIIAILIILAFAFGSQAVIGGLQYFYQDLGKEKIVNDDGTISIPADAQIKQNENNPNTYVGRVLNEKIQIGREDDFNNRLRWIFSYQQINPTLKYQLVRQAFDDSINKIIGMYKARKMDIKISKTTLAKEIGKRYFSVDGEIEYSAMRKDPKQVNKVTKSTMRDLLYERYVFDYFEALPVSKHEIEIAYKLENTKVKIKYINLASDDMEMSVLDDYYNNNKSKYTLYKLTRLVFKDEKTAEQSLIDAQATTDSNTFVEYGKKLEEEGKIITVKFDTDFALSEFLGNTELENAVKEMSKGDVSSRVITTDLGPIIFRIEETRIGSISEPMIQGKVKSDYLVENRDSIEAENKTRADNIYEYARTNGMDFISMVYPVKVEEPESSIQFMSYGFPNLSPDTTDDLLYMVKAFKVDKGTILAPYKHANGYMIVQITEKENVDDTKLTELHDNLYKKYSDQKTNDLEADFYKEERKKFKIVDNFDYVFKPQDFITQQQPQQ